MSNHPRRKNRAKHQAQSAWGLLTVGVAAVTLAGCDGETHQLTDCMKGGDGVCVQETFKNPPTLQPNGDGVYELTLAPTEIQIEGQRHCVRAYNGQYPAPTLETKAAAPGEKRQIRVNLRNAFTKSDYRALGELACTCTDTVTQSSCVPDEHHGGTCECKDTEGMMCHVFDFNLTNLHAHGSHVRPDYATGGGCVEGNGLSCRACQNDPDGGVHDCYFSDDVLHRVHPGEGAQVRWDIDEDGTHHAGLNWYHPHIHGSTAIQVASGATGAWIVRGALDEIAGIKKAKERVLVFTTPPLNYEPLADGQACDEDHITFNEFSKLATTAATMTNLVNGIRRPRMLMAPGQIERWRILHGSFLDEVFLVMFHGKDADCKDLDLLRPPVKLTQIGRDGLALPKPPTTEDWPFAPDYIFMSPGYRVEALLDGSEFSEGETLCLLSGRFLQKDTTGVTDDPVGITEVPTPEDILQAASNGDIVAIVNVTSDAGAATETQMPDLTQVANESPSMTLQNGSVDGLTRCQEVQALTKPEEIDQLAALWLLFYNTDSTDLCSCPDHNINCKGFEVTDRTKYTYDRVFQKGKVDHWRIVSGFDGHPFHIHINPFLVCPLPPKGSPHPNNKGRIFEPPFAHWRDTYLVNLDRTLDMLTEYRGFTGSYVYHCHKLTHEDHGMMELVHVCDPAEEACDTLCAGGKCAWQDCAPNDDNCKRALAATRCALDPSTCPEALLRCTPCDTMSCPPGAHCRTDEDPDGQLRCAPGCVADTDCPVTDTCDGTGTCVLTPCPGPCSPGQMCVHGACM